MERFHLPGFDGTVLNADSDGNGQRRRGDGPATPGRPGCLGR